MHNTSWNYWASHFHALQLGKVRAEPPSDTRLLSHGRVFDMLDNTELLRIRVAKGERLGKRDLFGVVSPYCVVRLERPDGEQIDEITLEKKKKVSGSVTHSWM
ncbi:hypothetical protein ANCDUO_08790 [Ancylostoma duodenale]|uniref:Uncharacterized protein n=1 Tax=Ancylostoma duodenale TaxID=51022 RepID=A0A0C2GPG1_9BILA|nr:hypothetical protein ANCDUO_08790 [Ancylostoma duodenale]